jgi:hypothetical protein
VTTRRRLDGGEQRAEVPAPPAPERGRARWSRVFWIGAAAILIVAALIAVVAILRGDFSDTEWKILGTLLALLVSGATAISGVALVERGAAPVLAWGAIAVGLAGFAVVTASIWNEFGDETLSKWAGTAIAFVIAFLLLATQRILLRVPRLAPVFYGTAASAAVAVALSLVLIWSDANDEGGETLGQALLVFCIFTALGYLLLPVLQRFTSAGVPESAERVVAELNGVELVATHAREGTLDVDLEPGERLLLRRRPA